MPGPRNPIRDIDQQIVKKLLNDGWKNQDILALVNDNRRIYGYNDLNNGRISDIKNNKDNRFNLNSASDNQLRLYKNQIEKGYVTISEMVDTVKDELEHWDDGLDSLVSEGLNLVEKTYENINQLHSNVLELEDILNTFVENLEQSISKPVNAVTLTTVKEVQGMTKTICNYLK